MELSKLNSNNSYYLEELINGKQIDKPKLLWLVKILTIVSISFLLLSIWKPILGFILFLKSFKVTFFIKKILVF